MDDNKELIAEIHDLICGEWEDGIVFFCVGDWRVPVRDCTTQDHFIDIGIRAALLYQELMRGE